MNEVIGSASFQYRFLSSIALLFLAAALFFAFFLPARAGASDNLSGFAWSSNIGWVSFNGTNDHDPATAGVQQSAVLYGVTLDAAGNISGHAWSPSIGWINFNRTAGCPSRADNPTCAPKLDRATGAVSGWAQACAGQTDAANCAGADGTDGWDGWISLIGVSPDYGATVTDCDWSGFAWGSPVIGWVSFNGTNDHDAATAGVQESSSPYGVIGTGNGCAAPPLSACSDGIDNDGDGLTDAGDFGCYDQVTRLYDLNDNDETDWVSKCSNGFDDDGDGVSDILDSGCHGSGGYNPNGTSEFDSRPQCANFFDDDNDSKVDLADPGCLNSSDEDETDVAECANGVDDEGDSTCDFTGCGAMPPDPQCASAADNQEQSQCDDGVDNDNDGLTDERDTGCWADVNDPWIDSLNPGSYDPTRDSERRIRFREEIPQ